MAQTRESACTTEGRSVVAIEQIIIQARVVDIHGPYTRLEHTLTLSEEEFRSMKGAQAALETFHGGDNKEDEEDDGCCLWIGWFPSYIRSCLTHFLPQEPSLTFARAAAAPPTTVPPSATNTNTKLVVHENKIALFECQTHVHGRPTTRTPTLSNTTANLNPSTILLRSTTAFAKSGPTSETTPVCAASSDDSSLCTVVSGLLKPPRECCGMIFYQQHIYDFHREGHEGQNPVVGETPDHTFKSSRTVSAPSFTASHASSETSIWERTT